MNTLEIGCRRDKEILASIKTCKALSTDQVRALHFPQQSGLRQAQRRLKVIQERDSQIKRVRPSLDYPYVYYIGKKPGKIDHLLALNWYYVYLQRRRASWEDLWLWQYEQDFKILLCDALAGVKNIQTKAIHWAFVEMDIAGSNNRYDKVENYNELYERSELWAGRWWAKYAKGFPDIICITDSPKRAQKIKTLIRDENVNGLNFKVFLLDQIIEGAGGCEAKL